MAWAKYLRNLMLEGHAMRRSKSESVVVFMGHDDSQTRHRLGFMTINTSYPRNHYLWQLKVAYRGEQTKLGIARVIVLPGGK